MLRGLARLDDIRRAVLRGLTRLADTRQAVLRGLARLAKGEFGKFYANLASLAGLANLARVAIPYFSCISSNTFFKHLPGWELMFHTLTPTPPVCIYDLNAETESNASPADHGEQHVE